MKAIFENLTAGIFGIAFLFGDIATFIYLMIHDAPDFNWWNWIIIIPIDIFLATIWPIYWVLNFMGMG